MADLRVPVSRPKPDIEGFMRSMRGERVPDRPPMEEYLVDNAVMKPILEDMLGRKWVDASDKIGCMDGRMDLAREDRAAIDAWLDNQIAFWLHMGYDFIRIEASLNLPAISHTARDTAAGNEDRLRTWQGLETGVIASRADLEKYPWPRVDDRCFYIHRYICGHLPDGLGFITCHAGGLYEHVSRLMGLEGLCMALHDDPGLVRAVADRLGGLLLQYNRRLLELPEVSAIFQGEDFGFNTGTLISPRDIREYFLPWHRKYAALIHAAGRPYYFHSCGKVDDIMEDLIVDVGIDGKHSFQDDVVPVWEFKERYGGRIAVLGGVDVHKLAHDTPEQVRSHVRKVIDRCAPGGRFAVGAGNSIPSYVPVANYLAMLDESLD
jgi:uroporphyrinogen decarboxylase